MPIKSIICDECNTETGEFREGYDNDVYCLPCYYRKGAREAKADYEERRESLMPQLEALKQARGEMRRTARDLKEFEDKKEQERNSTVLGGGTERDAYAPLTPAGVMSRLRYWSTKNPHRCWNARNLSTDTKDRGQIQRIGKILSTLLRQGRVVLVETSPRRAYKFPDAP